GQTFSQTTQALTGAATAADVKQKLLDLHLATVTDIWVSGEGRSGSPWVVTFLNSEAGVLDPITYTSTLANSSGDQPTITITQKHNGARPVQEVQEIWNNASQGNFTLILPDGTISSALPWNAPPTDVDPGSI